MKATLLSSSIWKLGQLRRSNGRNSQVFGQAMKKRPTGHYKKYSRGETLQLLPAAGRGAVSLIRQLREREHCSVAQIPGWRGAPRAAHAQFYHVTVRRMTKHFVQRCQSIHVYNLRSVSLSLHLMVRPTCLTNSLYLARRRVEKVAPSNRTRHVENATSLSIW